MMKATIFRSSLIGVMLASSTLFIGSAASAATTKMTFAYDFPGPDMEIIPVVVAQREGFFAAQDLSVDVKFPPSTSTTVKMLTTGSANVGFVTTSDMALAVDAKAPILSVANYSMSNNWGLFAKPGSKLTLSALKGKKIFSWGDTWTNAMLPFVLKKAGLTASQVTIVTASNDVPLLLNGRIDFTTSTTNYAYPGIQGATKKNPVALTGSSIGVPNVPIWVYAVTKSYASDHGANVKKFLTAIKNATKWASKNPTKAVADFEKAYPNSGYDHAYNTLGWNMTIPLLTNANGAYFTQTSAQWSTLAKAMKDTKQIATVPASSSYYTNQYLP